MRNKVNNEFGKCLSDLERELTLSCRLSVFLDEIATGERDFNPEETGSLIPLLCERMQFAQNKLNDLKNQLGKSM